MGYIKSAALEETGYVVLDRYNQELDPKEWLDIEYNDWKSSGDTRFAPLASFAGDIECNGFWNHKPPRTDKDGVWIDSQVEKAPNLTRRAQEPGANVGRCRVIELQPNTVRGLPLQPAPGRQQPPEPRRHRLGRPRILQPDGRQGQLLRPAREPHRPERRVPHRPPGRRAAHHRHPAPVARRDPRRRRAPLLPHHVVDVGPRARRLHREVPRHAGSPNVEVPQDVLDAGQAEQARRLAARAAYYAAKGQAEVTRDERGLILSTLARMAPVAFGRGHPLRELGSATATPNHTLVIPVGGGR